jgi:hypothetical protein
MSAKKAAAPAKTAAAAKPAAAKPAATAAKPAAAAAAPPKAPAKGAAAASTATAAKAAKAARVGTRSKSVRIHYKTHFYKPKTLKLDRKPKYARALPTSRATKFDKYIIVKRCVHLLR